MSRQKRSSRRFRSIEARFDDCRKWPRSGAIGNKASSSSVNGLIFPRPTDSILRVATFFPPGNYARVRPSRSIRQMALFSIWFISRLATNFFLRDLTRSRFYPAAWSTSEARSPNRRPCRYWGSVWGKGEIWSPASWTSAPARLCRWRSSWTTGPRPFTDCWSPTCLSRIPSRRRRLLSSTGKLISIDNIYIVILDLDKRSNKNYRNNKNSRYRIIYKE